jgi:peptidoglycan hydrolase CwlO-like protein
LYKRLKTSENQNQNLILLIKELENKIITLEKELTDTEAMVKKETNLRVELETEIRRLKDRIRFLEDL